MPAGDVGKRSIYLDAFAFESIIKHKLLADYQNKATAFSEGSESSNYVLYGLIGSKIGYI
ncbi:hypothetical protein SporoP33_03390 [Sporosarcina sp. P33]|nr:hypothetical protein SporoP33_03390 [Sporosarcina sp. P33]